MQDSALDTFIYIFSEEEREESQLEGLLLILLFFGWPLESALFASYFYRAIKWKETWVFHSSLTSGTISYLSCQETHHSHRPTLPFLKRIFNSFFTFHMEQSQSWLFLCFQTALATYSPQINSPLRFLFRVFKPKTASKQHNALRGWSILGSWSKISCPVALSSPSCCGMSMEVPPLSRWPHFSINSSFGWRGTFIPLRTIFQAAHPARQRSADDMGITC